MENVMKMLRLLHAHYPDVHYYLNVSTPLQVLVGAMLSAQVRDEVVNAVLPTLFRIYRKVEDYANADVRKLTALISRVTFAEKKAKNIKEACRIILEKYNGNVPRRVDELTTLPGVGSKTAHVVLQNAFDIVEGVVVDTHVLRVAYRLGWTSTNTNAEKSAKRLEQLIPKSEWKQLPWLLKAHGRAICKAPVPSCSRCPVEQLCPKKGVTKKS
jgi:endonuclease-3